MADKTGLDSAETVRVVLLSFLLQCTWAYIAGKETSTQVDRTTDGVVVANAYNRGAIGTCVIPLLPILTIRDMFRTMNAYTALSRI